MERRNTLLPPGFGPLKKDLGAIIREKRRDNHGEKLTQKELAELTGVPQETISRIERGHRFPKYATLYEIMGPLSIEWDHIAERADSSWPTLISSHDPQQDLADALRAGRREMNFTMRELSEEIGIPAATLSRLERAQSPRSPRLTKAKHNDKEPNPEDVSYVFTCQNLNLLAIIGWDIAGASWHPVFG